VSLAMVTTHVERLHIGARVTDSWSGQAEGDRLKQPATHAVRINGWPSSECKLSMGAANRPSMESR
jgi:hypothetical protein